MSQSPVRPMSAMTDAELTALARQIASRINDGETRDEWLVNLGAEAKRLVDMGVEAHVHCGIDPDRFTTRMTLEWYLGQFVGTVADGKFFALNAWRNCIDKFAPVTP